MKSTIVVTHQTVVHLLLEQPIKGTMSHVHTVIHVLVQVIVIMTLHHLTSIVHLHVHLKPVVSQHHMHVTAVINHLLLRHQLALLAKVRHHHLLILAHHLHRITRTHMPVVTTVVAQDSQPTLLTQHHLPNSLNIVVVNFPMPLWLPCWLHTHHAFH